MTMSTLHPLHSTTCTVFFPSPSPAFPLEIWTYAVVTIGCKYRSLEYNSVDAANEDEADDLANTLTDFINARSSLINA